MLVELEPIFNNEGASASLNYEINMSEEALFGGYPFKNPVRVSGSIANKTGIVEIKAIANFELYLECDRCAKEIVKPVSASVEHTLVTNVNDERNDELLVVQEMKFNLDPLVKEDIFLTLPNKFLCSENCKGVCPACGEDLNLGQCGCEKPADPRLEALKQLLDK